MELSTPTKYKANSLCHILQPQSDTIRIHGLFWLLRKCKLPDVSVVQPPPDSRMCSHYRQTRPANITMPLPITNRIGFPGCRHLGRQRLYLYTIAQLPTFRQRAWPKTKRPRCVCLSALACAALKNACFYSMTDLKQLRQNDIQKS
jgi:hypothetical protein